MRTGKIEINGKEYLLCFSARVVRSCAKRYGRNENIDNALNSGTEADQMDECFWLLAEMMDAGNRYAKEEGIENPKPLDFDTLYDVCGMDDIFNMKEHIFQTVSSGNEREVEIQPEKGKNAETTQQE